MKYEIQPIAFAHTPFKEKFGIPRQSGLSQVQATIELVGELNNEACIVDIEQHSHLWLIFMFHQNLEQGWKPSVRPPRLGGNKKTGVLATRSTFRPNGLGMSVVKLIKKQKICDNWQLVVEGLDLVDGTPIVDIKPYIPYSDCVLDATSQMAEQAPEMNMSVEFSTLARQQIEELAITQQQLTLVQQVLEQDPRPAYKKNKQDDKEYGICLYDFNIRWQVTDTQVVVNSISLTFTG